MQGGQISPLFHEGGQEDQVINLAILPRWVACFQAVEAKLVWGGPFRKQAWEMVGGVVGQIGVGEMRCKRYKWFFLCRIAGPLPISSFALSVRRQTGRSFCLRGMCRRTSRMSSGALWLGVPSG